MSKLSMLVCTWNVGNAEPPVDLSAWLGGSGNREYDIIVVGAQEANFSVDTPRTDGGDAEASAASTWSSQPPALTASTPVSAAASSSAAAAAAAVARAPKNVSMMSSPTTPPRRRASLVSSASPKTASNRAAGAFGPASGSPAPKKNVPPPVSTDSTADLLVPSPSMAYPDSPLTPSRRGAAAAAAAAAAVSGAVSGAAAAAAVAAGRGVSSVIGTGAGKSPPVTSPTQRPAPAAPPMAGPPVATAAAAAPAAAVGAAPEKERFTRRLLRVLTTANLRHRSSVPSGAHATVGHKMRSSKSLGAGVGVRRQNRSARTVNFAVNPGVAGGGGGPAGSESASPLSPAARIPIGMRHGTSLMEIGAARFSRTAAGMASPDNTLSASSGGSPSPFVRSVPLTNFARAGMDASAGAMLHSNGSVCGPTRDGPQGRGQDPEAGLRDSPGSPRRRTGGARLSNPGGARLSSGGRPPSSSSSPAAPGATTATFSSSEDDSFSLSDVEEDPEAAVRGRVAAELNPPSQAAVQSVTALPAGQRVSRRSVGAQVFPRVERGRSSARAFPRACSEGALNMRLSDLDDMDDDDDDLGSSRPMVQPAEMKVTDEHRTHETDDDGGGGSDRGLIEDDDGDEDDYGAETGMDDDDEDAAALGELQRKELSLGEPSDSDEDDTFDLYNVDNRRSLVVDESAASNMRHRVAKKHSKRRRVLRKTSDDALGNRFNSRVAACVGDEYVAVARQHLMEIKLQVFVHRRIKDRVLKTKTVTEATGIGHVVGNKGAVAVKLTIDDTTLCFVSSHLAAHEGAKFLRERNAQAQEILRSIDRAVPALHSFDHVFWMGDLNYRLDLSRVVPEAADWQHARKWKWARRRIAAGNYGELLKADELIGEMQGNNCVFGRFVEGPLEFMPTFKVHRDTEDALTDAIAEATASGASPETVSAASAAVMSMYQKERVPSYCDRVLWHSLPVHRKHAVLLEYSAVPSINTSDHKPVYAVFELTVPRPLTKYPLPPPLSSIKCTIDVRRLRLTASYTVSRVAGGGGYAAELGSGFDPVISTQHNEFLDDVVRTNVNGNIPLDDNTKGGRAGAGDSSFSSAAIGGGSDIHSRRAVKVEFLGPSLLLKGRSYSSVVTQRDSKRDGKVRECVANELPCLPCVPVLSLAELQFKYLTMVFSRSGSKVNSSCILPMSSLIHAPGHKLSTNLELLKHGRTIGTVELEAEFAISCEWWISSDNRKIVNRRGRPRG